MTSDSNIGRPHSFSLVGLALLLSVSLMLSGCRTTPTDVCKKWEGEKLATKCVAKAPETGDVFSDSTRFDIPDSPLVKGELLTYASDEVFARDADAHAKRRYDKMFGAPLVDARNAKARTQLLILGVGLDENKASALKQRVEALR